MLPEKSRTGTTFGIAAFIVDLCTVNPRSFLTASRDEPHCVAQSRPTRHVLAVAVLGGPQLTLKGMCWSHCQETSFRQHRASAANLVQAAEVGAVASKRVMAPTVADGDQVFTGFSGLSRMWDNDIPLRERTRKLGRLVIDKPAPGTGEAGCEGCVAKTVENLKFNCSALVPMVKMMHGRYRVLPGIEALQDELQALYVNVGLNPTVKVLSDQAWSLRYLFGVLKAYLYKKGAPKVSGRRLCLWLSWLLAILGPDNLFTRVWPGKDETLRCLLAEWGCDLENWTKAGVPKMPSFTLETSGCTSLQLEAKSSPVSQRSKDWTQISVLL